MRFQLSLLLRLSPVRPAAVTRRAWDGLGPSIVVGRRDQDGVERLTRRVDMARAQPGGLAIAEAADALKRVKDYPGHTGCPLSELSISKLVPLEDGRWAATQGPCRILAEFVLGRDAR